MKHTDFEVVKVIGRGAFGEVQLVSMSGLNGTYFFGVFFMKLFSIPSDEIDCKFLFVKSNCSRKSNDCKEPS